MEGRVLRSKVMYLELYFDEVLKGHGDELCCLKLG